MKKFYIVFSWIILSLILIVFIFTSLAGCGEPGLTLIFNPSPSPTSEDTNFNTAGMNSTEIINGELYNVE